MNEAIIAQSHNEGATQRSDMGLFTKFALNLVNVALPNLIAPEIVLTHPMSSMSGYVNYLKFTAGTSKGNIDAGYVFNDPFRLGKVDPNYTSSRVVKNYKATSEDATSFTMKWKPVIEGTITVKVTAEGVTKTFVDTAGTQAGKGSLTEVGEGDSITRRTIMVQPVENNTFGDTRLEGVDSKVETVVVQASGEAKTATAENAIDYATGVITWGGVTIAEGNDVEVAYTYNNVVIPQNDLPLLTAHMEALPLLARARRIAIYYSQMAAFQAKTDYGVSLGDQLAEKAVGQLAYEIDTEVTNLLINSAPTDETLKFDRTLPIGVSKKDHYEGFAEITAQAAAVVYQRTQRYMPNYMLIAPDILPILGFVSGWQPASVTRVNGPYMAGTLNGLKVYVTPNIAKGDFVVGVNDGDFAASAAVYAPYMPIVPTQLLGHADGSMSQGWSTLYDLKILNRDLLVKGHVE